MKTNRTIAAVLAAALTATSMPAYAADTGDHSIVSAGDGVTLHSEDGRKTDTKVSVNKEGDVIENGCSGDVYVGSEARYVGNGAFSDNTDITSVTFAEGVKYIKRLCLQWLYST